MSASAQSVDTRYEFSIDGGTLGSVMDTVHKITGVELLFSNDLVPVDGLNPVKGQFTVTEALEIMLQGTGLSSGLTERGMVVITRKTGAKAPFGETEDVNKQIRQSLLAGAAAAAVTLGHQQALAQEAPEQVVADTERKLDTIVITGIRASLEQAVDKKRNSNVIADVISATDLGRFPDENVAESLQRVTGVQIQRLRGEGSRVSIRGLPPVFTSTTLNGRNLASAFALDNLEAASRSFEFSALPSEFVNSLEVYKSPMASIQEGGLSGTVIIRTPSPLDIGKRQISLSAQGAHESNSGEIAPRVAGIYSDVFADGKVGVTIGGAFSQRDSESHATLSRGFRKSREYTQNILLLERFEEEKERMSLLGKVEWEPVDSMRLYADAFYTSLDNTSVRSAAAYNFGNTIGRVRPGSPEQKVPELTQQENVNGTLLHTKLGLTNVEMRPGGRVQVRDGETLGVSTGGKYEVGDWQFSGEIGFSTSEQSADGLNLLTRGYIPQAAYDATVDSDVSSLILDEASQAYADDPNNYEFLNFFGEFGSKIEDEIFNAKFDATRDLDLGFESAFKFGAAFSEQNQTGIYRRLDINQDVIADLLNLSRNEAGNYSAASLVELVDAGGGSFLDAYEGGARVPSLFMGSRARDIVNSLDRGTLAQLGTVSEDTAAAIDVTEKIMSVYGQMDFASNDHRISGNFGVRLVNTDQTTRGFAPDLSGITIEPDGGALIKIPPGAPVTVSRDYLDILPSANLQIELTDDLVARVAASRTMARPNLGQISPSTTASNVPPTINRNNPMLDPFRSNNFDMALEWYFDDASILSATFFHKDLVSLIEKDTSIENLTITEILGDGTRNQISEEFIVNSIVNGDGVNVQGVELTFQHNFSNLPGLLANTGALLNYTYIDNSDPDKVVGASANNFNASGYYEGDHLSLRLSYTWRDEYLVNDGAQEGFGQFIEAGGVLDGNITYDINENFSMVLEGINLLDEPIGSFDGNGFPAVFEDNGRRILFGAKAKF